MKVTPKFPPVLYLGFSKLNDARHVNLTDEELAEDYGDWMDKIIDNNRYKHMRRQKML